MLSSFIGPAPLWSAAAGRRGARAPFGRNETIASDDAENTGSLALAKQAGPAGRQRDGGSPRRSRADFERADNALDAWNTPGDRLGCLLLLARFHGAAEIDDLLPTHHAEASQVRVLLSNQACLHLGLDPGIGPRIDGRASGGNGGGQDHDQETPAHHE